MTNLEKAVRHLVHLIKTYESDTFSASAAGVTTKRAERIAARLINFIEEDLDGCTIDEAWEKTKGV